MEIGRLSAMAFRNGSRRRIKIRFKNSYKGNFMKKLFLIIGAPGSSKTTDASLIAQEDAKFAHFSTGDLLRAEVANGSELGKLIDGFISKGNLVPLDVVVNAIVSAIKSSDKSKRHHRRLPTQRRADDRARQGASRTKRDRVKRRDRSGR